jgi:hypothetical protein
MKYKEANWDQIKKDLENTLTTINNIYEKSDSIPSFFSGLMPELSFLMLLK